MDAPHAPDTWLVSDFEAGLCSKDQIGGPRDPAPTTEIAPASNEKLGLRQRLTKDALAAYHELGGVEYLKKNPELLDKILARAIAPEPVTNTQNNVNVEWPAWLTARRLAYQESQEVATDVNILPKPDAD